MLSLIPKQRQFYTLFRESAAQVMESLTVLHALLDSDGPSFEEWATKLRDVEHRADDVTHRIHAELNQSFITPFDREDIFALAGCLDDVVDLAEEVADTIVLDCVREISPEARHMGAILLEIGHELVQAFDRLDTRNDMEQYWIRVHDLENQADRVTRLAMGMLFQDEHNPVEVIKWKDIYSLLEKTVDRTEDVANILETITITNA